MENKGILAKIFLLLFSLLICLLILELGVRTVGYTDQTGQFYFGGRKIRPYASIKKAEADKINYFIEHEKDLYLGYDPFLGWDVRPNYTYDKLFKSNSAGIRSEPREYSLTPDKEVIRIALFGDSFVHGDEVAFNETWGYFLEQDLKRLGKNVEVINFGVPAYGNDQAYLRYLKTGYKYSPDIVIIGFQAENFERNVNLFRFFYYEKEVYLPLSKPRFILQGDKLKLINSPTPRPEKLIEEMLYNQDFFSKYDYYCQPQETLSYGILLKSKLIGLILTYNSSPQKKGYYADAGRDKYSLDNEPAQLGVSIINKFVKEVKNNRSEVFLIHLPKIPDIMTALKNNDLEYQEVYDKLSSEHNMIDPMGELKKMARKTSIAKLIKGNHYSPETHKVIGRVITDFLVSSSTAMENK